MAHSDSERAALSSQQQTMPDGAPGAAPTGAAGSSSSKVLAGPAARKEQHEMKRRAKNNRRAKSPGPGAYSPALSTLNKGDKNQSSSFSSKSKRGIDKEMGAAKGGGDPGAYDPYTLKELASTSKKSFARSMRQGQGDFGGKDKRELAVEIMGESTPGPGAYNGGEMMRTGKKAALSAFDTGERMPMSSFKSKSAQRETAENQNVPGAGAYTPNWKAIEKEPMNPAMQMKGKGKRLESVTQVTDPIVGPGSYESHLERSIQVTTSKAVSKASRANPGFGTLTLAHDLPFLDAVQDAMDDPGPGAYDNAKSTLNKANDGHRSAFKSGSQRGLKELGALDMGDPGSYDPYTISDLASTSKKSFGKSNRQGQGEFGGKMRRELAIEIMGEATPGPGAYNGGDMMRTGKVAALAALDSGEKMPMSSFKSKSKQREEPEGSTVPGAGAYSPNHMMTLDSRMSVNAGASMRGKGARFVGASKLERDQSVEPGPGAYETEILRTGGKSALSAYDTGEMMPSAAFASDSIRQMPWPETNGAGGGKAAASS